MLEGASTGERRRDREGLLAISNLDRGRRCGCRIFRQGILRLRAFRTLNERGVFAEATIQDLRPHPGRRGPEGGWHLKYTFRPGDNDVINGGAVVSRSVAAQYQVGQHVTIVYDPEDPTLSALSADQVWMIFLGDLRFVIAIIIAAGALAWRYLLGGRTHRSLL